MPLNKPILSIDKLTFEIDGKRLIDEVSLDIRAGETVLLCGRSGSGKSTLANLINGYYPEYGGKQTVTRLTVNGQDISRQSVVERSDKVQTIFQNARLSFSMRNLREEMVFCLENSRTPVSEIDRTVKHKAEAFNLTELLDRSFDDLSGGELQKAAFVCASLTDVPLFIMDEPFANMDEDTIETYTDYMNELTASGKAVLIIDHHVKRWTDVDRWLLMDAQQQLQDLSELPDTKDRIDRLIAEGIWPEELKAKQQMLQSAETVLELNGVSVFYKKTRRRSLFKKETTVHTVIEDASFELEKGALAALVGPSGVGKSSLFKAILKATPYKGEIRLQEENTQKLKPTDLYRQVGLVFQDPSLQFVKTTLLDEMEISLRAWETVEESQIEPEAKALLETHGFHNKEKQSPWLISQGQQRRLAVICMTVGKQRLLLVDEPTYGQDASNARLIMDTLSELCRDGMTCLFTSHDRQLVDAYADRIFEIREKKVFKQR
ncbi:Duplicated ATPase component YkoD of energizing module of thiamin-regulated ECF transporter for HydroxyMethylPyrimidine [Alkalibacterium sp. AK22]|uniref:ABC transporter ATP-binding protein n=1 Tax=Alkalibacterium sp. AK22 TaxID=1229520 RepID=UPI000451CF40|nr:ABC transporter ATP-binding protein [Alkalibacterium sp. AK22]EXJ23857.1 Duplicated ATPase component YkoD of energizing module of thiamin-regulated ECF transporter for HydroxyMethylPyrimidine [Alkalibacterium sp. AK22]